MRNRNTQGFTLIELLIVIAIIGILAAVLIPNLLNARSRAFDTAAQSCLKELSTLEEVIASDSPFQYRDPTAAEITALNSCGGDVDITGTVTTTTFTFSAFHSSGSSEYTVSNGTGVVRAGPTPAAAYAAYP